MKFNYYDRRYTGLPKETVFEPIPNEIKESFENEILSLLKPISAELDEVEANVMVFYNQKGDILTFSVSGCNCDIMDSAHKLLSDMLYPYLVRMQSNLV